MIGSSLLLAPEGYQISRSVRLRSSASAYLTRTPASAGNQKTWTWSGWVKRGSLAASNQILFSSDNGTSNTTWLEFGFDSAHAFFVTSYTADVVGTTAVFRDPSAWYHIVVQFDSTQATSANRCRIYFNGVQQTVTGAGFTLNANYGVNAAQAHDIGRRNWPSGVGLYYDGYLTEVNFIDGQALTPASFGETNLVTGVWQPKKYTGTYGTNGFYLNFSDNSNNTAATIGKDNSGNGNNWTPNNISVTAGTTFDSMLDVPTQWADGGNGRGNYPTMNPLDVAPTEGSGRAQILDGNLRLVGGNQFARGWLLPTSGQWYWEITLLDAYVGPPNLWGLHGVSSGLGGNVTGVYCYADTVGGIMQDGTKVQTFSTWANNDVIGFAYNSGTRSMSVYRNGTQLGTSVTANATDKYIYAYLNGTADTSSVAYNFGQRPFAYTPPTGFRALNTLNLPTPTILKGNEYMDATLWTGNGSVPRNITGIGFQPDLVWIKSRSNAFWHQLTDSNRGVNKALFSNATDAETTTNAVSAFLSNGFTVNNTDVNTSSATFVGWQWKEGPTQGFDIVTYTGTGANRTIAHSLGVAPAMIIVKRRDSAGFSWIVGATAIGWGNYLVLNQTLASGAGSTVWNSTAPTSSVFSLGTDTFVNANAGTYVAYLFSEVAGFSRFGSYTGNGSTDGPFCFTGFLPRWLMIKRTDSATNADWVLLDTARDSINESGNILYANLSNAATTFGSVDFLSNGFKVRQSSGLNVSSGTYIYAAFASNPFKHSLAR